MSNIVNEMDEGLAGDIDLWKYFVLQLRYVILCDKMILFNL